MARWSAVSLMRPDTWTSPLDRMTATGSRCQPSASGMQSSSIDWMFAAFFSDHDLLISPATSCRPYAADGAPPREIEGRDASQGGAEPFGMLANACWNPSLCIPAGFTEDGLPVGLQLVARRHRDDQLLRLGRLFEQAQPWPSPPTFS